MKKIILAALATAAFTGTANAAIVDFEDKNAFSCNGSGTDSSGAFTYTYGFYVCYYSPSNPADFPTPPPSTVMASGFRPTTFSLTAGGTFSLASVDLAFGPFGHSGLTSDITTVVGNVFGGGTVTADLNVGRNFQTALLGWTNLTSVTFGVLQQSGEYLAFDNIQYNSGAVPEPATWVMMLGGFGLVGGAMRRRQKVSVTYA